MKAFIICLFCVPFYGYSQSLTPEVVSSTGDHFSTTSAQLSWTLGEVAIDTYAGSSNQLTQGFHQPERPTVSLNEIENNISINAYPNPFNSALNIQIDELDEQVDVIIYNAAGQEVYRDNYSGNSTKSMDLSFLDTGIYMIQFKTSSKTIKTLKIQKI